MYVLLREAEIEQHGEARREKRVGKISEEIIVMRRFQPAEHAFETIRRKLIHMQHFNAAKRKQRRRNDDKDYIKYRVHLYQTNLPSAAANLA